MPTPKRLTRRRDYHATTPIRLQLTTLRVTRAQATATRQLAERVERAS